MAVILITETSAWYLDGADPLTLGITRDTSEQIAVQIQGGPGLHQVQERSEFFSGDWQPLHGLTTETNVTVQTKSPQKFFRANEAPANDILIYTNTLSVLNRGREIFRYDTFGDEAFWGDTLKLHKAILGEDLGGVGPGVSPKTALSVGLKVDVDALPESIRKALADGKVDLDAPATTVSLLKLNSVLGVTGKFDSEGKMTGLGIQCALCHSTVDNSFTAGIGHRLDGWPNRDLNVGAIINLSPDLSSLSGILKVDESTVRNVITNWGPGKFDAELLMDGKGFRPDGKTAATLLPAAFGLAGVNLHTYTGWGSVTYWNAFVAKLEMQGQGNFFDPRLNDTNTFPVAARMGFGNVRHEPDLVSPKLADLHAYQLSIPAPKPASDSYNHQSAERGKALFSGKAKCATCHVPPLFTEPGWNMHTPDEIGIDDFQANRSPDKRYRTTPLGGLFTRAKGGFYHDGRFADLDAVVQHYNSHLKLNLSSDERDDLVEYLKSL